jgi:hypothetical protein
MLCVRYIVYTLEKGQTYPLSIEDYDNHKGSVAKKKYLVVILKGLCSKTKWSAVSRQT